MSKAVESRDASLVFGKFSEMRVVVFSLCPLRADDTGDRPDLALESAWERLRVDDGVNVGGRSKTGDF
jgi:hypothetical protein